MTRIEAENLLSNYKDPEDTTLKIIVMDFLFETKHFFAFSCSHKGYEKQNFTYAVFKNTGDIVLAPTD